MCGLAGFFGFNANSTEDLSHYAKKMADSIYHRGPNDSGLWVDRNAQIALSHRRLSILDVSTAGKQPMLSSNGRYVIAYNGEVYNFTEIKQDLTNEGYTFHSHSDTEVVVNAIEAWGLLAATERFNGIFAFAVWDRKKDELHLVRDRVGVKPLYYARTSNGWAFASELKALKLAPGFNADISREAIGLFTRYGYIPSPWTIYLSANKLEPGRILTLTSPSTTPQTSQYWSCGEALSNGIRNRNVEQFSEQEATAQLDNLLQDAVQQQMVSDVELGAFLSGGIDSSLVCGLMQTVSSRPIQTFTIGFSESEYNEAQYAAEVAAHLGTDHHELYVSPQDALNVIPDLPVIYDEPFADVSQIPTFLVSKMAGKQVTVALSGDGGDELFYGYNRYERIAKLWSRNHLLPDFARTILGEGVRIASNGQQPGGKTSRLVEILKATSPAVFYERMVSTWQLTDALVLNSHSPKSIFEKHQERTEDLEFFDLMMYLDQKYYLPDDILTKVDRASMSVGLEVRVPILDHRVIEFAWGLPHRLKTHNQQSKYILRSVLNKYVPKHFFERPKQGFGVPIATWLRGPLLDWAESLLDKKRLEEDGIFDPIFVRKVWEEHLSGKYDRTPYLWTILMFQAWHHQDAE